MENTNLNVAPYYDDFAEDKNFHRVLFRPGFSVQARELTALQTILQNQVERHGRHMFKEGTVVIPGATGFTNEYYAVKLQGLLETTEVSSYIQDFVGKKITGSTSGVVAEVIEAVAANASDPITLFVKYIATGTDNLTTVFANGEKISADATVGAFGAGIDSAQLQATDATAIGSSANIQEGVYFIRGHFVKVAEQRIVLDKYTNVPSYRVGLTVTETLETPEEDTSLLDNAQGSSNVNAKGAHRLKISLTLAKLALDSEEDENFIELLRTDTGVVQEKVRNTEYSVLGDTLARRTYDLYGDFTINKFDVEKLENLDDGLNDGVYSAGETTDSGNTASDDFLTTQISPGKAYVRGYEIETIVPTYVDVEKPRTFNSFNGAVTPVEVGNFALIRNIHGQPEITPEISGSISKPYRDIQLFDTQNTTGGSSNGTKIGVARARAIEHHANQTAGTVDVMSADAQFKLYMFDLRMFTKITMSGTPAAAGAGGMVTGAKITGADSGAYGYVHSDSTGTSLVLTTVVGVFQSGEKLISTGSSVADEFMETSGNTDVTVSAISSFNFDAVKQVYMDSTAGASEDFTADFVLDDSFTINGSITIAGGDKDAVTGFQSDFANDLRVGDIISVPTGASGALETRKVDSITNQVLDLNSDVTNGVTSVQLKRLRAKLVDQNKNVLLRKLQKETIKTLKTTANNFITDSSVTIRKTFVGTTSSAGVVTFTSTGANETFNSVDNEDYNLVVTAAGAGSAVVGDIINLNSDEVTIVNSSTSLSITSTSLLGNAATVRLVATMTKTVATEKTKVRNRMSMVIVDNDGVGGAAAFGTSAHDHEISLGYADTHKLAAVFESPDSSTNPRLPQWTFTGGTGVFTQGEIVTGQTSGAKAFVINPQSPMTFVPIRDAVFDAGEQILGLESSETATLETFSAGDTLITNNFTLDTGQRDNFYDVGRIVRKGSSPAPTGKLLVVFDYFTHSTGDFFTVDSYSTISYKDIPTYSATRVDPEVAQPSGEYDLRDTVDFRPRVADATMSATNVALTDPAQLYTADKVTDVSFTFESRNFSGTGGSTTNIPKDGSNFGYDFEFYLPRIDALYLTSAGEFIVSKGTPSETPTDPPVVQDAMLIAELALNAYILSLDDVQLIVKDNPKYSMSDIAKLENRIDNMEYYTVLNLLEKEADSLQIQDANGLDRFKSGFLVDNFAGHATGDVKHPDYRVAVDMQAGELRPKYFMKNVTMVEDNTTETDRTSSGYQKTGSILTLPYEHKVTANQPYATRVENLNPVLNFSWAGNMKLTPEGDEWFETRRLPDLVINREGNFDTILAANRNALGTVWNAWQTQWSGVTATSTTRFRERSWARAQRRVPFRPIIERTTSTTSTRETRSGIRTTVVPRISQESRGDRVVARAVVPFIRARNVHFEATGMKPLTQVYPFFDKRNVSKYVFPTGGGVKGKVSDLVTSLVGSWSSISKIEFDYHKIGSDPLIATVSYRTQTRGAYIPINTQQYPGSTRSVVTESGLTLTPNHNGEVGIRGFFTDTDNRLGTDDRLFDVRIYDQDGNLIPRTLYQIESSKRFTNIGRAIDSSTNSFAFFNTSRYSNKNKQCEITIRVIDGAKTLLPSTGRLKRYDYLRADETSLVTDAAGSIEGYFAIPDARTRNNPRFRTGERLFRLTSSATNTKSPEPETFAQATYSANGEIRSTRETIVRTRNARVITRNVNQTRTSSNTETRDAIVGWWDPVAQSFMPQVEGGEYITKIDVFFSQVDDNIPVTCQIREMNTGYPTTKVLPFASKTLLPEECAVSNDATAATTFTFDEPVYVKNGVEVAIVLQTDSPDYLVWISRMGEKDVGGKRLVSEQPYLGVLFKSQNNSTWTAYDMEDLKFKIYRAKFDTSKTANIKFVNDEVETADLETDPIRTFNGVSKVKVLHRDHHMYDDTKNNVVISGISSGVTSTLSGAITNTSTTLTLASTLTDVSTSTAVTLKLFSVNAEGDAVSEVVTGTTNASDAKIVESITRGVEGTAIAFASGVSVERYSIAGIPLTEINKTHTDINDSQMDSYTVATSTAATSSGNFGGSSGIVSENAQMDQMQALFSTIESPDTSLTAKMRSTSGTSPSGNESSFVKQTLAQSENIPINDNYVFDAPKLIASPINESNEMGGEKSLEVTFTMQTNKDNLSPIIDLDKRSMVTVANRLDNIDSSSAVYPTSEYTPPTDPDGDSNECVYITRKAQLKNPANSIKCYLDAAKFQSSEIQVMYKILRSDDASDFDEIGWQYFNTDGSPDTNVNNSVNIDDFIEREYTADDIGEFISFAIKIRMQGSNSSEVPRCKDLRAIALAT